MMGQVVLRDDHGQRVLTMNRPEPPDSDVIMATSNVGDRRAFVFVGYEWNTPVYQLMNECRDGQSL